MHTQFVKLVQALGSVGDALLFVAPDIRVILQDFGGEHEDVFVHQGDPELRRIAGALDCVDGGHPA